MEHATPANPSTHRSCCHRLDADTGPGPVNMPAMKGALYLLAIASLRTGQGELDLLKCDKCAALNVYSCCMSWRLYVCCIYVCMSEGHVQAAEMKFL